MKIKKIILLILLAVSFVAFNRVSRDIAITTLEEAYEMALGEEDNSTYEYEANEAEKSNADVEQQKIMLKFPHVSYKQTFITLDNGTLVDTRLFEAWTVPNPQTFNYSKEDLKYIFNLIIDHVYAINAGSKIKDFHTTNEGEELLMHSTMMGQDGSDSNHFHPAIDEFVEINQNTSLFVEEIVLSSAGIGIRIIISNYADERIHIWPLLYESYPYSWRINRYFNHLSEQYWIPDHEHLWKYVEPFRVHWEG